MCENMYTLKIRYHINLRLNKEISYLQKYTLVKSRSSHNKTIFDLNKLLYYFIDTALISLIYCTCNTDIFCIYY